MPTKSISLCPGARIVSYGSKTPFSDIRASFEFHISKSKVQPKVLLSLNKASSAEDIARIVKGVTKSGDFLFFAELPYHPWLQTLTANSEVPRFVSYIFGNPLIARHILEHEPAAGLFIPLRILIQEHHSTQGSPERNEERTVTTLSYHLPSSLLPVVTLDANAALKDALLDLDSKIEKLVLSVLKDDAKVPAQSRL
ncbi:hypothetical protein DFP72DRAFT_1060922 [Ephemerocybe angulata]|uniref:DUF302 domain-containing protein n=1 Tax=Ephemerocybe angulata TaxID=980116 RepID=A0A8H6IBW3_9AGAR|nr:hypothetical protein DFP72DRAFT_1060922 [Tulosesus angulatus]